MDHSAVDKTVVCRTKKVHRSELPCDPTPSVTQAPLDATEHVVGSGDDCVTWKKAFANVGAAGAGVPAHRVNP